MIYVWLYCLAWWLVQDAAKVTFYWLMRHNNWFGWNDTGRVVLSHGAEQMLRNSASHADLRGRSSPRVLHADASAADHVVIGVDPAGVRDSRRDSNGSSVAFSPFHSGDKLLP